MEMIPYGDFFHALNVCRAALSSKGRVVEDAVF